MGKTPAEYWILEYKRNIGALFEVGIVYHTGSCRNRLAVIKTLDETFVRIDMPCTEMAYQLMAVGDQTVEIRAHGCTCQVLETEKFRLSSKQRLLRIYERIKEIGSVLENADWHEKYKQDDIEREANKPFMESLERKLKS